jgi:lipopolysaccharide assembly protein A
VRLFHWLVTAPVALVLVVFAVSNRAVVTVTLWPFPVEISAPVYLLVLLSLLVGFLVGMLVAWIGGRSSRRAARAHAKRADSLKREIEDLHANPASAKPASLPPAD